MYSQDNGRADGGERFWNDVETRLGTPVLAHCLGSYVSGRETPGPLWGLLYVTDYSLYFHHFDQRNWFSAVVQSHSTEVTFELSFDLRLRLSERTPSGWIRRLMDSHRNAYEIIDVSGEQSPFVFTIEQPNSRLLEVLRSKISEDSKSL